MHAVRPESVANKHRLHRIEEMTKALVSGGYLDINNPMDVIYEAINLIDLLEQQSNNSEHESEVRRGR
jgi:hypothetical protein